MLIFFDPSGTFISDFTDATQIPSPCQLRIPERNLLPETRDLMRCLHYSIHTERAYYEWITRFVRFLHLRAQEALFVEAEKKVEDFLTHLAVQGDVAADSEPGVQRSGFFISASPELAFGGGSGGPLTQISPRACGVDAERGEAGIGIAGGNRRASDEVVVGM
jgi:hypothetical protein